MRVSSEIVLISEISRWLEVYPVWVAWIQHERLRKGSNSVRQMNSPFLLVMGPGADPWKSISFSGGLEFKITQTRSMPTVKGGGEPSSIVTLPLMMTG